MSFIPSVLKGFRKPSRQSSARRTRLEVESLESRIVPYALSGDQWLHPNLITMSFIPDGTVVEGSFNGLITSNLFSAMNAKFGSPAVWEAPMIKAAQTWAKYSNINLSIVTDNGTQSGDGMFQQGDPGMGDIRISGYDFGMPTLAGTEMPQPDNNYSGAGDIFFNTAQVWNINTTYDIYTVSLHEFGHAFGLYHADTQASVMYPYYESQFGDLSADDAAGIRAIYGPRVADTYDVGAGNNTLATASNITISTTTKTALVTGVDLTTTTDSDYYKFTVPAGSSGTLKLVVQSAGLSLMSPQVNVYNNAGTQIASANSTNRGATISLNVAVTSGQTYKFLVKGYDTSPFATGAYAFTLNTGTLANPVIPLPVTTELNGDPVSSGGGQDLKIDGYGPDPRRDGHHLPAPGTWTGSAIQVFLNSLSPLLTQLSAGGNSFYVGATPSSAQVSTVADAVAKLLAAKSALVTNPSIRAGQWKDSLDASLAALDAAFLNQDWFSV